MWRSRVTAPGASMEAGASEREAVVAEALGRLLEAEVPLAITCLQVPIFVGFGLTLA